MNLPHEWVRLPGPADLVNTIVDDLVGGNSVLAGLYKDALPGVAAEIADLLKRKGLRRWSAVRSTEARKVEPSESVLRRSGDYDDAGTFVLWVEADEEDVAAAWVGHARQIAESQEQPRICIASRMAHASGFKEEAHLRRRLWLDFVTASDCRVLLERRGRRFGHNPVHVALKSALIAELAGSDLACAARLADEPLGRILAGKDHPPERIWAAQVSVLFPLIERERRQLLKDHRDNWQLPHVREDGQEIQDLEKLEIGDMAVQSRMIESLRAEEKRIGWLHRIRNNLAHLEIVPWGTLTSPIALRIVDFRENAG